MDGMRGGGGGKERSELEVLDAYCVRTGATFVRGRNWRILRCCGVSSEAFWRMAR
jgi:hypothetical protein